MTRAVSLVWVIPSWVAAAAMSPMQMQMQMMKQQLQRLSLQLQQAHQRQRLQRIRSPLPMLLTNERDIATCCRYTHPPRRISCTAASAISHSWTTLTPTAIRRTMQNACSFRLLACCATKMRFVYWLRCPLVALVAYSIYIYFYASINMRIKASWVFLSLTTLIKWIS